MPFWRRRGSSGHGIERSCHHIEHVACSITDVVFIEMGGTVVRSSNNRFASGADQHALFPNAQNKKAVTITRNCFSDYCAFVVGRAGFEPATNGLKVRCSTS
jgi:hypothetical protein